MARDRGRVYKGNPDDTSFIGPAIKLVAATRSDTVDDPAGVARAIYLDSAGTVKFVDGLGNEITLTALAIGVVHPIQVQRVFSSVTSVTAGNVYLLY